MRLRTRLKYRKISYYECNWNLYNWLVAGSEPWVILRLFLIFQDLSLMILIKRILIKNKHKVQTSCDVLDVPLFTELFIEMNIVTYLNFNLWELCWLFSNFIPNVQSGVVVRALEKDLNVFQPGFKSTLWYLKVSLNGYSQTGHSPTLQLPKKQ